MQQFVKLEDLHADEGGTERDCQHHPADDFVGVALAVPYLQHRHAEGQAAGQQQHRFAEYKAQIEQLASSRAPGCAIDEHAKRREQRGEDQAVTHQVQPEAKLEAGLRLFGVMRVVVVMRMRGVGLVMRCLRGLGAQFQGRRHDQLAPFSCAKRARSMRSTSAAGT
ncbi:hypothetical protein D3C85_1441850 [compost metagenome]